MEYVGGVGVIGGEFLFHLFDQRQIGCEKGSARRQEFQSGKLTVRYADTHCTEGRGEDCGVFDEGVHAGIVGPSRVNENGRLGITSSGRFPRQG